MNCNTPTNDPTPNTQSESETMVHPAFARLQENASLACALERDRGQFELLIEWALEAGADPQDVLSKLSDEVQHLLDDLAEEYGFEK